MKLFQLQKDGSYVVVIKNSLRFDLAIQHVSVGLSFRQTATVMTQYRNACKIPKLAGINDHMNYVKLIKVLLDFLSPIWRDKVISISSDGENTMTGRHGGVVTFARARVFESRLSHLVCPAPAENCGQERDACILKWLLQHQRQLMVHVTNKRPVQAPSDQWWITAAALVPVFEKLQITFARLQSPDLIISQQRKFLSNLIVELAGSFNMQSISDIQLDDLDHTTIIVRGDWLIEKESDIMHIHDQGFWVRDLHSSLSDFDQQSTLEEVATFAFCIVANGLQIQAERDLATTLRELEIPPVMPADLVKLCPALFIKNILDPYRNHVAKHWNQDMIDLIEIQHCELIVVYGREPDVKAVLDAHDEKTYFNDAWDCLRGRFLHLRQFCGGLLTAFPNTTSVESDFSIVTWEKDNSRTSLTSLPLAGIIHAQQFQRMKSIMMELTQPTQQTGVYPTWHIQLK
ncbi:hypothetical protein BASA62_004868 [Batrachochytrium salamandrivorans]|nr:hypothetical protein BASA62_004868 [Batrachochytrium salamandrivorans]